MTVDEIKNKFILVDQPRVMSLMLHDVVDFTIENYDGFDKSINCKNCEGFMSIEYCSIIDGDCSMILEYCNGCTKFELKLD